MTAPTTQAAPNPSPSDQLLEAIAQRAADIVLTNLNADTPASPYLNVDEAADYLRCERQRIYDLVSARRLQKYKDGSRTLVRRDDIDTYLQSTQRSSGWQR